MSTLGERIKKLLTENNMTQRQLAKKAECTEAAISHYIKGDRVPRSRVMTAIAAALGTTSDYLIDGIPSDMQSELGYAKKLIARNAEHMSKDQKMEIINILMGGDNE